MKKLILFIFIVGLIAFYFVPGQIPIVHACSGTPTLSAETVRSGPNVFYEHRSPIVINDSINSINDQIHAVASGNNCSGSVQYYFNSAYWNGNNWVEFDVSTNWQTANYREVLLDEGIRQYSLGVYTLSNGTRSPFRELYLYSMTKTSSSSEISATSAKLFWSLRMSYYWETYPVQFYLLIGKDPAILGDRTMAVGEIGPIDAFSSDYDSSTQRITWGVNNHLVSNLDPNSTYYWRVRGDYPSVLDSFFAGGSFTTATILPASTNYRRVFVTSSGYQGDLKAAANSLGRSASTGLAAADNICQYHADSRSLGGNWKAWLSDNTASADSRLEHASVPYKLLTDLTVANNWSDLITLKGSSYLQNPINVTESTEISVTSNVWTGTNAEGGSANIHCSGWTANPDTNGWAGNTDLTNHSWTSSTYVTCLHPNIFPKLYCFEQPASPTPTPTPTPSPTPTATPTPTPTQVIGPCGISNMSIYNGLITSPFLDGQSSRSGDDLFESKCIIDTKAQFAPFDIPTFNELKSLYYDQSKSHKTTLTSISAAPTFSGDALYLVDRDLNINGSPTGSGTPIIFVNDNLNVAANYTYGSPTTGTVFVVKGNVNIHKDVTRIDAVIISDGIICTAFDFGTSSCPDSNIITQPLTINGSLISIKQPNPADINPQPAIRFRRSLTDNSAAAEIINHQVKYLVILRNLFSDTWQKWSEIP